MLVINVYTIHQGAGTGLVGISLAIAATECDIVLTDVADVVPQLERNIHLSGHGISTKNRIRAIELDWCKQGYVACVFLLRCLTLFEVMF